MTDTESVVVSSLSPDQKSDLNFQQAGIHAQRKHHCKNIFNLKPATLHAEKSNNI
jgi:hypothetical protein